MGEVISPDGNTGGLCVGSIGGEGGIVTAAGCAFGRFCPGESDAGTSHTYPIDAALIVRNVYSQWPLGKRRTMKPCEPGQNQTPPDRRARWQIHEQLHCDCHPVFRPVKQLRVWNFLAP